VLPNPGIRDFRDPKVSWNNVSKQWVMALAVTDHIEFYSSPDLKKWNKLSEFGKGIGAHGGVWECPDLFPLTDVEGNTHWVLFVSINPGGPRGGSATQYFVGNFDGKNFVSQDTVTRWIDYGADNYAGVTWSDIPATDGRRLFMGWMSNWQYANLVPTKAWRSATTLPREIVLNKKADAFELKFIPVKELASIQSEPTTYNGTALLNNPLSMIQFDVDDSQEFSFTLSNAENEKVVVAVKQGVMTFDRTASGVIDFNSDFPAVHQIHVGDIQIKTVKLYIDLASIEIFINDGERVLTEIVFPTNPYNKMQLDKVNPQIKISAITSILN
jgi:fructan beta-fructosidase